MNKLLLYIPVFISGGSVLVIEILGTRILGPFYGVSIFLWSSLISITLLALSIGYFWGGKLADNHKGFKIFALLFAAAGIWTVFIPLLTNPVIQFSETFGLRFAVIISSFILFVPVLTLLGMISPYAVKLNTNSLESIGNSAGSLYAISTIGSVVFALLTGFILIPKAGVMNITLCTGIALLLTSFILLFLTKNLGFLSSLIILVFLFISTAAFFLPFTKGKNVLAEIESPYAEIKVIEDDYSRMLLIDGGVHSSVDKQNLVNNHRYAWVLDVLKNTFTYSGDMLLIGLGAGSVHLSFYNDKWDVESVEIDPAVSYTAEKYFGFNLSEAIIHHTDGRVFLKYTETKYDLIILDAFGSSSIPFHLITKEAFQLARKRLKTDGFFALNLEAEGWQDIIVRSTAATLKESFKNVIALPIAEPPNMIGNVILFASDNAIELKKELERNYMDLDYRFSANYEKVHAWDNRFEPDITGVHVITDDLNPVDIWSERINYTARKELRKYFSEMEF